MTANNHHRLKYIIQILHCFKTYLIIKQFDFYVWIRSTGDIHLLQFASLQNGNYEKIHLLEYTNHISIIISNIATNFNNLFYILPVSFPEDGTYLRDRHRSPKYWLLPSSTAAKSFHSSTGPAKSTEFKGS